MAWWRLEWRLGLGMARRLGLGMGLRRLELGLGLGMGLLRLGMGMGLEPVLVVASQLVQPVVRRLLPRTLRGLPLSRLVRVAFVAPIKEGGLLLSLPFSFSLRRK